LRNEGLTISAAATIIALSVFPVAAAEIVLDCTLDQWSRIDGVDNVPRQNNPKVTFAIAFDDASNRVTYIMAPVVKILDTGNSVRKDEIDFAGEFVIGSTIHKHSGNVSRLTGRLTTFDEHVDEWGRRIESTPWILQTGTCVAGPRKF
jgi:hypothetical protein